MKQILMCAAVVIAAFANDYGASGIFGNVKGNMNFNEWGSALQGQGSITWGNVSNASVSNASQTEALKNRPVDYKNAPNYQAEMLNQQADNQSAFSIAVTYQNTSGIQGDVESISAKSNEIQSFTRNQTTSNELVFGTYDENGTLIGSDSANISVEVNATENSMCMVKNGGKRIYRECSATSQCQMQGGDTLLYDCGKVKQGTTNEAIVIFAVVKAISESIKCE